MLIIDSLLVGGLRFVLGKIAAAVDAELNDESHLREQLLAAQMRFELAEISQQEFDTLEAEIIARIREIKQRQRGGDTGVIVSGDMKVTGIEATFEGDEH
jgi:gas vesicle protein GvpG